jgi:hypothetical protein
MNELFAGRRGKNEGLYENRDRGFCGEPFYNDFQRLDAH